MQSNWCLKNRMRYSRLKPSPRTDAVTAFDDALRVSVIERGDARCVESLFHNVESLGLLKGGDPEESRRLFDELAVCLKIYSWGLRFNGQSEVARSQALVTVAAGSGQDPYPRELLWRLAFASDPNTSNASSGIQVGGDLFLPTVLWRPDVRRSTDWATRMEALRRAGHFSTYASAHAELCAGTCEMDGAVAGDENWAALWGAPSPVLDSASVDAFVRSPKYCQLPVNDVGISILARVLCDLRRPLRDSDKTDAQILSLAIPYCDLVVVDAHMSSVVNGLGLGQRYGTTVLPAQTAGLGQGAEWLRTELRE